MDKYCGITIMPAEQVLVLQKYPFDKCDSDNPAWAAIYFTNIWAE